MCKYTNDLGLWRILRRIDPEFLLNVSRFYLYGIIGGSVLLFTRENRVFAYGFNGNGRLGLGHFRLDVSEKPEEIEQLFNKKIISIYGSDFIVALVKNDYNDQCYLLTWGSNNYGQLGIGDKQDRCNPIRIGDSEFIIDKVECSQTHVIAIDYRKRCFCWGDNRFGQINGSLTNTYYCSPKLIQLHESDSIKIINIACCETASLALTEDNFLYIWGKLNNYIITRPFRIDFVMNNNNIGVKKLLGMAKSFAILTDNNDVILIKQKNERNRDQLLLQNNFLIKYLNPSLKIIDIYGSLTFDTCNFIMLSKTGYCFIWDMMKSNIIETKMTSIPDVSALYTCYYTNIHSEIPSELVYNNETISLNTFNNEFKSDLCIKTYTYTHFLRKIFVQQKILSEHSNYLREFCLNNIEIDNEEACGYKIILRNYSYLVVYAYLRYIYTGILRIDPLCIAELYKLAEEFHDNQLKKLIPEFLYKQTDLNLF